MTDTPTLTPGDRDPALTWWEPGFSWFWTKEFRRERKRDGVSYRVRVKCDKETRFCRYASESFRCPPSPDAMVTVDELMIDAFRAARAWMRSLGCGPNPHGTPGGDT